MFRKAVLVCLGLLWASGALDAVQLRLDLRAIDQAILLGYSRLESERRAFHAPYRITVRRPPVDYIDIVTPFRRVVLAAESRAAIGDRGFGQKEALALLAPAPDQIDIYVELTFHPHNTFVGVPDYAVSLRAAASSTLLEPRTIARYPRFTPRVDALPQLLPPAPVAAGAGQPLVGGTIVAGFDGRRLDADGVYIVRVSERGSILAEAEVNLGRLR